MAPKMLGLSIRGRHSHSTLPLGATSAVVSQSERNPYSAIGGNGLPPSATVSIGSELRWSIRAVSGRSRPEAGKSGSAHGEGAVLKTGHGAGGVPREDAQDVASGGQAPPRGQDGPLARGRRGTGHRASVAEQAQVNVGGAGRLGDGAGDLDLAAADLAGLAGHDAGGAARALGAGRSGSTGSSGVALRAGATRVAR